MPSPITSLILLAAMTGTNAGGSDLIFRALDDEMARSKTLQLKGHEKPFIVEYTVNDVDSFVTTACFGAITSDSCGRSRWLNTHIVLGDYKLNSNHANNGFSNNPMMSIFSTFARTHGGGTTLPLDDNYFALRRAIWRDTDEKYKSTIENFAAKKAYMMANEVMDRPDDLAPAEPVVAVRPVGMLNVNRAQWQSRLKDLSGIFRNYPNIQRSMLAFATLSDNRWFVSSEGFRNRMNRPVTLLMTMASANRTDGSRVGDCDLVVVDTADHMPNAADLQKRVRELADRVEQLRTAKEMNEDYDGPILFEGEAAAQFLSEELAPNLGNSGDNGGFGASKNQWREKLGLRVLPTFISVVDDPTAKEYANQPIYCSHDIDDDGMRAEKVTLVDHGILKTFAMSRQPTRHLTKSNGHSLSGVGLPSNLFFVADNPVSPSELRNKLIQEGRDQGLKYVYVVRRMSNVISSFASQTGFASLLSESGALPPLCAYRVYVDDGHEELVRDVYFSHLTTRVLRDIVAAGNDAKPYMPISGAVANAFVTPSILIKEIELQKRQGKPTKNEPILPNPLFESKK